MSVIDNAILKLQAHALAIPDINAAPAHIVEDSMVMPMSLAYIASGEGSVDGRGTCRLILTVNVDIHFSRLSLTMAYQQMQSLIPTYLQRLAGDPTLGGTVDTIIFPVTCMVMPYEWSQSVTEMVRFSVPLKFLETSIEA